MDQGDSVTEGSQPFPGPLDCLLVPVDSQNTKARSGVFQYQFSVASVSQSAIYDQTVFSGVKVLENFLRQYRFVMLLHV
jgi:hypothetical protein